jgi:hypothetical protein
MTSRLKLTMFVPEAEGCEIGRGRWQPLEDRIGEVTPVENLARSEIGGVPANS